MELPRIRKEALHFVRQSHSMSIFQESQQTLAETYNNLGCLLNNKGDMQGSLKYLRQAAGIEIDMDFEVFIMWRLLAPPGSHILAAEPCSNGHQHLHHPVEPAAA